MASNRPMLAARATSAIAAIALSLSLAACGETAGDAPAEGETTATEPAADLDIVKVRHDNFEEIGDAFKAIRGELEKGSPDFAVIQTNAQIIDTNAQKVSGHFPEGTGPASGADTEALDSIWEKPAEFTAAHEKLTAASATMLAAANSGDAAAVGEAVKELGGSCKNCHDQFREKDD
jgi:cytochrome c556